MGRGSTFAVACLLVIAWGASGPLFHYSDTWQLVINTGTTIVTFLMVFLLQHLQNRDSAAIQLKLDELIRVNHNARNKLLTLEELSEAELDQIKMAFSKLAGAVGTDLGGANEDVASIKQAEIVVVRLRRVEP